MMKVVYFAWLRERTGVSEETVEVGSMTSVAHLIEHLKGLSEGHEMAFADMAAVRVAVNMKVTDFDAPLAGAEEIAFFPPMTGG